MKERLNKPAARLAALALFYAYLPLNDLLGQSCPGLGGLTLNVVAAPAPTLNAPAQLCPAGANGTIAVNQVFSTYDWNTGGNSQSIAITTPGTYTVTVTGAGVCSATASVIVAPAPAPTPTISLNPYACTGTVTLNAGQGFAAYNWSNGGGAGATATFGSPGTYTVTVTDAQGCTGTDNFNASIPPPPLVSISGGLSICTGQLSALDATPGFSSYAWNTGANTASTGISSGGVYTVTATDAFGCTDTETVTVVANTPPIPTVTSAEVCPGASVTLSVTNTPFQSYAWSTGSTAATTTVIAPGAYTVTVVAANGCTGTATANVSPLPAPNPNISPAVYACNGQFNLNAGPGFVTYNWNTGAATPAITVGISGIYTVTVTNAQGCTGTDDFNASIPPPPVVNISGSATFCAGNNTTLSATPGFIYQWSNGSSGPSITVNTAGTFTVTATDAFGCTDTDNFTVSELPLPAPTLTAPPNICSGTAGTLGTSAPFATYNWSNGQNTPTISVTAAGAYTVTVAAANGCTNTASTTITVLSAPNPNISQAVYTCNGQITLDAGAGFSAYAWSNGGGTSAITVNTSNNYTVTVTSAQGCTGTDSYFANIPLPPVVNISGNITFCAGGNATLNATPGFSYQWNNGGNTPSITVSTAGLFTVTATDAFGCTATDNFAVNILPVPAPNIAGPASICAGTAGILSTTAPFAAYTWSTGQNTPTISASAAGSYTVTVTAANGCTGMDTQTLSVTPAPAPSIAAAPYTCNNQLILNAGSGFSAYAWSTGGIAAAITVNSSNSYTVTVTNAQGCTGTATYFADIPAPPVVSISGNSAICPGGNTTLVATPGWSSYLWSNAGTSSSILVSAAGNYSVTVTDAFGCTATDELGVSALSPPQPNISGPAQICIGGTATYSVPGSFPAFNWSNGLNNPSITVNAAGTYTVTVTAANGCTGTDTQILSIANSLQPQITELPYTCTGQLTFDGGAGFSAYNWSGGQTTQSITVSTNGTYTVTVSDAGGCTGTASISASIPTPPVVAISGNSSICAGVTTTLNATGGSSAYTWSTGQVGASIHVSAAGPYAVTATDAAGCTATATFLLSTVPAPNPVIAGPTVICDKDSGSLALNGLFSQYAWSTGANTPGIAIAAGGSYTVTVTDAQGCTGTAAQAVVQAPLPVPVLSEQPYACTGTRTLEAGAGFSAYLWSDGQSTPAVSVQTAGIFTVTVTDTNGCTGTGALAVTIPPLPQAGISGKNNFCLPSNIALEATPGFAGYAWSTGQTTNTLTVDQSGIFTVTVTDDIGCTDTASITITAFAPPQPQINGPAAVCAGGTASFVVGQNYAAYAWSDGTSGAGITTPAAGLYTVTVTDANGCTGTAGAALVVNSNPSPGIALEPYNCDGQIGLTASTGFNTYSWAGPAGFAANGAQLSAQASGVYSVTVSDGNGCSGTAAVQVNIPVSPVLTVSGPAFVCAGQSATLMAAPGFDSYQWSGGQSGPSITADQATTYTVTATDAAGCTATASLALGLAPPLAPVIDGSTSVCPGGSTVFVVLGNYATYQWSNGASTASITVSQPGNYEVSVTDAAGCSGTASAVLNSPTLVAPVVYSVPALCPGASITSAVTNEQNFVQFNWSTGATTPFTTGVTGGQSYTVTVTDANGCTQTAGFTIALAPTPAPVVTQQPYACNGQIILNAGNGFATYAWTGPGGFAASGQQATVNAAGTYTVTVTNNLACPGTGTAQVVIPSNPVASIAGAGAICPGGSTVLSAGPGFSTYAWSNGSNLPTASINAAGIYTVTVTDALGCTAAASAQVSAFPPVAVSIDGDYLLCGSGSSAMLTASGSSGAFAWSNGAAVAVLTVTQAGPYTVTLTDANGCIATASQTVNAGTPVATTLQRTTCRQQEAGTQTILFTAANGCDSVVTTITQYQPELPGLALDLEPEIQAKIGQVVVLNIAGNFPIDSVAFQSPFALSCSNCLDPALTATASGVIRVTAFDPDGCRASDEVQLLVRRELDLYVPNAFQPGSAGNGFFTVYAGPEIKSVRNFNVFDRWGNGLFHRDDLPTNDPAAGWDGTFRDRPMQPGVYVYYFEVLLADGSTEVFSGDLTLLD